MTSPTERPSLTEIAKLPLAERRDVIYQAEIADLQARLAASEEENQQYAEVIRDWSLADTEGRTPQDTLASAETLQAWINRQSSANARLRELAANPPNGASALAELAKLRCALEEISGHRADYSAIRAIAVAALGERSTSEGHVHDASCEVLPHGPGITSEGAGS